MSVRKDQNKRKKLRQKALKVSGINSAGSKTSGSNRQFMQPDKITKSLRFRSHPERHWSDTFAGDIRIRLEIGVHRYQNGDGHCNEHLI